MAIRCSQLGTSITPGGKAADKAAAGAVKSSSMKPPAVVVGEAAAARPAVSARTTGGYIDAFSPLYNSQNPPPPPLVDDSPPVKARRLPQPRPGSASITGSPASTGSGGSGKNKKWRDATGQKYVAHPCPPSPLCCAQITPDSV